MTLDEMSARFEGIADYLQQAYDKGHEDGFKQGYSTALEEIKEKFDKIVEEQRGYRS